VTSNRTGRSGHFAADWAKAGAAAIAITDTKSDAKTEINCAMFLPQQRQFAEPEYPPTGKTITASAASPAA
jgi:hypothetical protein